MNCQFSIFKYYQVVLEHSSAKHSSMLASIKFLAKQQHVLNALKVLNSCHKLYLLLELIKARGEKQEQNQEQNTESNPTLVSSYDPCFLFKLCLKQRGMLCYSCPVQFKTSSFSHLLPNEMKWFSYHLMFCPHRLSSQPNKAVLNHDQI